MKIILAVDLCESEFYKDPLIYEELRNWSSDLKAEVLPVYIHSGNPADAVPQTSQQTLDILKPFSELTIIQIPGANRRKEIEALIAFCNQQNAEMIALASQGKAKLEKKLLGSFAESLLMEAEIPILFLEEEVRSQPKKNKVLFATDFSEFSNQAFSLFLKHIKLQKPEIIIFNAIQLPQFYAAGPVYSHALQVLPQSYWDEQQKWAEMRAGELVSIAEAQGFQVRIEICNQVFSVETSLQENVRREKVKLVAMASVSSPMQRFLLGSVSRSLLRTRIKPIWICGPRCLDQSIEKKGDL